MAVLFRRPRLTRAKEGAMSPSPRLAAALVLAAFAASTEAIAQHTIEIAPASSGATRPRISGDGANVAFMSVMAGGALNLVRIDGSDRHAVPGVVISYDMALSADGRRL